MSADRTELSAIVEALAAQFTARGLAVERFETHISSVLLAGEYAYKLKKPVDFGFLDFSTLERRRHYCERELALNKRYAPALYLDVLPITAGPTLGGEGPVLEWALRMRRFATQQRLDIALADGRVAEDDIVAIAAELATTHAQAAPAPAAKYGTPELVRQQLLDGLVFLTPCVPDVPALRTELEATFRTHTAAFENRLRDGYVRDCHGDLHLSNLVRYEGRWQAFDCIEFDDELRYIDTASDLAFLLMDLDARAHETLADTLLNEYLAVGGDYELFSVLDFYLVYRSIVRAKVACLSMVGSADDATRRDAQLRATRHFELARRYLAPRGAPALYLTHGVSGSGKSWLARRLARARGFVHLRSDVERKRRAGLAATAASHSALGADLYDAAHTAATYDDLLRIAGQLLRHGYSPIVDASFLAAARRAPFMKLAQQRGIDFVILDCAAPRATLEARITARQAAGTDASEATVAVLAHQLATREPLTAEERCYAVAASELDDARLAALPGTGRLSRTTLTPE